MSEPKERRVRAREVWERLHQPKPSSDYQKNQLRVLHRHADSILLRNRQDKTLHVLHARTPNPKGPAPEVVEAPENLTEVIGWYGGKEIVRFRKTPEC